MKENKKISATSMTKREWDEKSQTWITINTASFCKDKMIIS